jgi:ferredoxin-like protein FixX
MPNKENHTKALTQWKVQDFVFRVDGAEPGDFIAHDEQKCQGCGDCALVCAASLWAVPEGKKARLSPKYHERCLECAACYAMCEQGAIDFRYPEGGSGIVIKHG